MPEISNVFKPTDKQLKFLEGLLNPEVDASIVAVCRYADIAPSTYYRNWRSNPEFSKWLKQQYEAACRDLTPILDKIAWRLATTDYRFFEFLQRKYGQMSGQAENLMLGLHDIVAGKFVPPLPEDLEPQVLQSITGEGIEELEEAKR